MASGRSPEGRLHGASPPGPGATAWPAGLGGTAEHGLLEASGRAWVPWRLCPRGTWHTEHRCLRTVQKTRDCPSRRLPSSPQPRREQVLPCQLPQAPAPLSRACPLQPPCRAGFTEPPEASEAGMAVRPLALCSAHVQWLGVELRPGAGVRVWGRAVKDSWGGGDTRGVPGSAKGTGHRALGGSTGGSPARGPGSQALAGAAHVRPPVASAGSHSQHPGRAAGTEDKGPKPLNPGGSSFSQAASLAGPAWPGLRGLTARGGGRHT